ncbi:hypothetical protein D3C85_1286940 [compost metagenome]
MYAAGGLRQSRVPTLSVARPEKRQQTDRRQCRADATGGARDRHPDRGALCRAMGPGAGECAQRPYRSDRRRLPDATAPDLPALPATGDPRYADPDLDATAAPAAIPALGRPAGSGRHHRGQQQFRSGFRPVCRDQPQAAAGRQRQERVADAEPGACRLPDLRGCAGSRLCLQPQHQGPACLHGAGQPRKAVPDRGAGLRLQ